MTLAAGILLGILVAWATAPPEASRIATLMFLTTLAVTLGAAWHTHVRGNLPGEGFLYSQVVFDIALITTIVHITTVGDDVVFAPLYVFVIAEGALLLPFPGGVLIAALASMVYLADLLWGHGGVANMSTVSLQIGLFATVALITGWLGDRVGRTWRALGAVQSELARLRLDTGDILANISTGILTIVDGGRLAYLNPAGERLLGLRREQWEGAPVLDAVDELAPGLASAVRRTIESLSPVSRVKTTVRKGTSELVLGISTAVLESAEDEEPSVTVIFQDITDLERVDMLDRRNERLEAIAELSASLAHEIKNPLASIRSAVEQLDNDAVPADDRKLLQRLVLSESDRLSRLLTEFLDFSVMRLSGKAGIDFSGVVQHAITLVKQHPDYALGGKIESEGVEGSILLPGDSDFLHRLVFNLILNAVQCTGPEGSVTISVEEHADHGQARAANILNPVRLSVQDTGPGIPAEEVERIFDPFYTTREGGSGLGLAVVHRAVLAHNGAIFVEDVPDGGAKFVVFLPGAKSPVPLKEIATR